MIVLQISPNQGPRLLQGHGERGLVTALAIRLARFGRIETSPRVLRQVQGQSGRHLRLAGKDCRCLRCLHLFLHGVWSVAYPKHLGPHFHGIKPLPLICHFGCAVMVSTPPPVEQVLGLEGEGGREGKMATHYFITPILPHPLLHEPVTPTLPPEPVSPPCPLNLPHPPCWSRHPHPLNLPHPYFLDIRGRRMFYTQPTTPSATLHLPRPLNPPCHAHLAGLLLDVPEGGFQTALRQEAVLQTLEEQEERWLVGEEEGRVSDAIVANQNQLSRPSWAHDRQRESWVELRHDPGTCGSN